MKKGSQFIESPRAAGRRICCLDEEAAAQLDEQTGTLTSGSNNVRTKPGDGYHGGMGKAGDVQVSLRRQRRGEPVLLRRQGHQEGTRAGQRPPHGQALDLMEYLLTLLSTPDGGVILDPFAGSGTTLLAAKQLGRR